MQLLPACLPARIRTSIMIDRMIEYPLHCSLSLRPFVLQDANANWDPEAPPPNYNYGRRRSRAVLYQLSGHYKTEKAKKIHSKLNTNVSHLLGHYVREMASYISPSLHLSLIQRTSKRIFLGCVIPTLATGASPRIIGKAFLRDSV